MCVVQLKSLINLCGTIEIPICAVQHEKLDKTSQNDTHAGRAEILEKTSQSGPHPLDPRKSWKKPRNLSPIPGTRKSWKNLTI